MPAKIVFIIGEHIEDLDDTLLDVKFHLELFPELATRKLDGGVRYPQHATRTMAVVQELILDAKKSNSYSLGIVTHCGRAVNLAGCMIADRLIAAADIEVWMFNGEKPSSGTPDAVFHYNEEGHLLDWPTGWFEPESY